MLGLMSADIDAIPRPRLAGAAFGVKWRLSAAAERRHAFLGRGPAALGASVRFDLAEAVGAVDRAVHPRLEWNLRLVAAG